MKGLTRDERGTATVWMLVFVPVLLTAMLFLIAQTQAVTGADIDLQEGLNSAVKAAAMQVTLDSQAAGTPHINTANAHTAFKYELARNLGLNPTTLVPLPGSMVAEAPDYALVVYNGDGDFVGSGARTAYKYSFQGGLLSSGDLIASGFPQTFSVTDNNISLGTGGSVTVTLGSAVEKRPGVLAVVKEKQARIMGKYDMYITRWAAAKVVY
ncbi:MAG: hypothetical protein ACYC2T_08350 [Bacillota bacterium]